jgi:hypothetical protein
MAQERTRKTCYLSSIVMGASPKTPSMLAEEVILQGRALLCCMRDILAWLAAVESLRV